MPEHIFANRKTLIVTMAEIKVLLPMAECIELQRQVFTAHAAGNAYNAPNTWLKVPQRNSWMKLLAGYVGGGEEAMGMKVLARFPKNPPGMNIGSLVALFDPKDGFPQAIMDGIYITAIRTGAGGGLSALYCARKNSTRVGILGSGVQARFNLVAIKQLLPQVTGAAVFSRSKDGREAFARRMQTETGMSIKAVASVAEAVSGADILLTATNSPEPILPRELVVPGVHIVAAGIKTEIHPSALQNARIIADGLQTSREDGKFQLALAQGYVSDSDLQTEIGDIILGKVPGRTGDDEVTIFDSSGLAVQDVICAQHVYRRAKELDRGTWVDLGLGDSP